MNARQAVLENESHIHNLVIGAKEMSKRLGITTLEALDRKIKAYVKYSQNDTEIAAWECRRDEALAILNDDNVKIEWNNKSEQEKTATGITIDDRYLVINAPVLPSLSSWNKPFDELSDLKKQRLVSFFESQKHK